MSPRQPPDLTKSLHKRLPKVHEKYLFKRGNKMVKPNFNFQKRQKEIARKKKNEEKRLRKLDKNAVQTAEKPVQSPNEREIK